MLHSRQKVNKNYVLHKEFVLSDLKHPLLEQAFQSAEECCADANATIDVLSQALEALLPEAPEVRETLSQSFLQADQLIDHCGEIPENLQQLRLTSCTVHSTSGLSPEIDVLQEALAGIEQRRIARRQRHE